MPHPSTVVDMFREDIEHARNAWLKTIKDAFIQPAKLTGTSDHPQQFQQQSGCDGVRQGARGRHSETIRIDRFGHEKTLDSQGKTLKNQGLGTIRAERLELSTHGLKVHGAPNEIVDETTDPQQIQQQLQSTDPQNTSSTDEKTTFLAVAVDSVRKSRLAVEKLLGFISLDDHYSLGTLGPILAGLRDAEQEIDKI
jgi:hypothetical protein